MSQLHLPARASGGAGDALVASLPPSASLVDQDPRLLLQSAGLSQSRDLIKGSSVCMHSFLPS